MGLKKGNIDIGAVFLDNVVIDDDLSTELNAQIDELSNQQDLLSALAQAINIKRGVSGTAEPNRPIDPSATDNAGIIEYNTSVLSRYSDKIEAFIGEVNTIPAGKYNITKTLDAHGAQNLTITDAPGATNSEINTGLEVGKVIYNGQNLSTDYRENLVLGMNYNDLYKNDTITTLGDYKFYGDDGVTGVNCENLQIVGSNCFYDCDGIYNVYLPSIRSLHSYAFYNCSYLQRVELGENLQSMENYIFGYCNNLKRVIIRNPNRVPDIGSDLFQNSSITNGTGFVFVPNELIESYRSHAIWAKYANAIDGITFTHMSMTVPDKINVYNGNLNGGICKVFYNDVLTCLADPDQEGYTLEVVSGNATVNSSGQITLNSGVAAGATVTLKATSTYNPSFSITKSIPVVNIVQTLSINLNSGQWVDSGTTKNGHIVYKSDAGSYNLDNGTSTAIITVVGYEKVYLYIRSYAESNYDYTEAFALDTAASRNQGLYTTKGKQSSSTYIECIYTLDGGTHTIQVMYSKDGSQHNNDDRGYFYVYAE